MTFAAVMRIGSLEIMGALVIFGGIAAAWPTARARARLAEAFQLRFRIAEPTLAGLREREADLTLPERGTAMLGRSGGASVPLTDPEVSRRHARLDLAAGVLYLSDAGSRNGTFLNGKRVADGGIEVRLGDYVDVGNTRITLIGMEPASCT